MSAKWFTAGVATATAAAAYFKPWEALKGVTTQESSNVDDCAKINAIVFALNGARVELHGLDPSVTLSDYLRSHEGVTGSKVGCGEGGCGACAVMISFMDPASGNVVHCTINACLKKLATCDGVAITTVEGIKATDGALHPIQQRFVDYNATQCGFCTPGMVMAVYGSLSKGNTSAADLERSIDGNICRCTGYRPILDAAKSASQDGQVEDLVNKTATKGPISKAECTPSFPTFLTEFGSRKLAFQAEAGLKWFKLTNLTAVQNMLLQEKDNAKVVVGHTSKGIYKGDDCGVYIDISCVPELCINTTTDKGVEFGANTTLTDFETTLVELSSSLEVSTTVSFKPIIEHVRFIAGHHVRNAGSITGNLMLAKTKAFESDLATVLAGVGAVVKVALVQNKHVAFSVVEFMDYEMPAGALVQTIFVPFAKKGDIYRSYKVAMRPQNAHALVNAAFKLNVTKENEKVTINEATLVFGAIETKHAMHAMVTEKLLIGRILDKKTFSDSVSTLLAEISIDDESAAWKEARNQLIGNFFFKFFKTVANESGVSVDLEFNQKLIEVSQGLQKVSMNDTSHHPVGKSMPHMAAKLQVSGAALYTGDVQLPQDTLYAAYVQTTQGRSKILSIDCTAAMSQVSVVDFIGAKEIPGKNKYHPWMAGEIFATYSHYVGIPIGIILAKSQKAAEKAAMMVTCTYERDDGDVIVTNAQAVERDSFNGVKRHYARGDVDAAFTNSQHVVEGKCSSKSQSHFYMETQNSWAMPDEDGTIKMGSAMQWPDGVQVSVATALGLDCKDVNVTNRRVGGGFGGKLFSHVPVATACAIGAQLSGKCVRFVCNRNTDMQTVGGRHEIDCNYKIGFSSDGQIDAIKFDVMMNCGYITDGSDFTINSTARCCDQTYRIPNFEVTATGTKTNLPSRQPVRAPGEVQASYIIETALEAVASSLIQTQKLQESLSSVSHRVRTMNMYPTEEKMLITHDNSVITLGQWSMPTIWPRIEEMSNFKTKSIEIEEFNKTNKWRKQGIAITPVKYKVSQTHMNALVNVYRDGSVLISHAGIEIGQGLNTKVLQSATFALSQLGCEIPMSKIRLQDSNTGIVPNASMTGGSTTSEAACAAVMQACDQIVQRLKPVFDKLSKKGAPTWQKVAASAASSEVNLSSQSQWVDTEHMYHNFGACACHVEVDVLTGEMTMLKTDILYDCGKSLNPSIDLGQCEGGFMMALGFYFREEATFDNAGKLTSDGTWTYKPPCSKDVPKILNVEFLQDRPFDKGILSSKASGEPPMVLASAAFFATRHAVAAAREDRGLDTHAFEFNSPATVDRILMACGSIGTSEMAETMTTN